MIASMQTSHSKFLLPRLAARTMDQEDALSVSTSKEGSSLDFDRRAFPKVRRRWIRLGVPPKLVDDALQVTPGVQGQTWSLQRAKR